VSDDTPRQSEGRRLEDLWAGDFGDEYVERNTDFDHRRGFWHDLLADHPCDRVLEVGCNVGGNLRWIAERIPPRCVYGIDVNEKALAVLRTQFPAVNAIWSPARDLPFRDRWFDLVFTMGVLIHQPEQTLPVVMTEMVRTSRRWVLCGEYFGETTEEVAYRGNRGALFRRDYGAGFQEMFPDLRLVNQGLLSRDEGWDDVTWWLFERS
jgi:pseudaminic acid biosynthesis-associated methylase